MKDISAYFKDESCFLCGEPSDIDFNCLYNGELYKAMICFSCMSDRESDLHVLRDVLAKANARHEAVEQLRAADAAPREGSENYV